MPLKLYQVTLGAAATQLTTTNQPICEALVNPAAHDIFLGTSGVTASTGVKVATASTVPIRVGSAQARSSFDATELWIVGTQNDTVNVLAVVL